MFTITQMAIACIITAVVIFILMRLIKPKDGILYIDTTDPEVDHYKFEVNDLEEIKKKYYITIKIVKR